MRALDRRLDLRARATRSFVRISVALGAHGALLIVSFLSSAKLTTTLRAEPNRATIELGVLSAAMKHRARAITRTSIAIFLVWVVGALALTGCGESAEAKAKKQVCGARNDIAKQIAALQALTLSSSSAATAKASFEAIGKDVTQIKNAQSKLAPSRKQQVEAATSTFVTRVNSIATSLTSNVSPSTALTQFKSALSQLGAAYSQTLGPISCE